jgi:hypothetical protein
MRDKVHIDKNGTVIPIEDLKTSHLINIIKFIRRKAKEGFSTFSGGGSCDDDFWFEVDELFGRDALDYLNYDDYMEEALKRKLRI